MLDYSAARPSSVRLFLVIYLDIKANDARIRAGFKTLYIGRVAENVKAGSAV
jgi:hypothetical protein